MSELPLDYVAAWRFVGRFDGLGKSRIEVRGPDRAKFLHNLTTNEVKRLAPGRGQEAFVTDPKGKTLGFITLLASDDCLLLRTESESQPAVFAHLQKYGIFDDITLTDVTADTFEFHLAGPDAQEVFALAGVEALDAGEYAHSLAAIDGRPVRLVRESPFGRPGLTILGANSDAADVRAALLKRFPGMLEVTADSAEALRIEAGRPRSGRDVTPENLPQEVGRDDRAISFVKGCYLGQETVARIDAIGHVNRFLKGLRFLEPGPLPPAGATVKVGEATIGSVTSSAQSPGWGVPVALAYLKASHTTAMTAVRVSFGEDARAAVVQDLPMFPDLGFQA